MALTVIVVGAGSRGNKYSKYATLFPDELQIVGVADPDKHAVKHLKAQHSVCTLVWENWKELVDEGERMADAVFLCTQDRDHVDPFRELLRLGYHILLEKPMGATLAECETILRVQQTYPDRVVQVCHVLRYLPMYQQAKKIIDSGVLGKISTVVHKEPVGHEHFAHAFVRGNWSTLETSCPSIVAKCCHDVDLLLHLFGTCTGKPLVLASQTVFNPSNKPPESGDAEYCTDCALRDTCVYSSKRHYEDGATPKNIKKWPRKIVTGQVIQDIEDFEEARSTLQTHLHHQRYDKCVFSGHNTVNDAYVATWKTDDNTMVTLHMIPVSEKVCERETVVYAANGELRLYMGNDTGSVVEQYDFRTRKTTRHLNMTEHKVPEEMPGHCGADFLNVKAFVTAARHKDTDAVLTSVAESIVSHRFAFLIDECAQ